MRTRLNSRLIPRHLGNTHRAVRCAMRGPSALPLVHFTAGTGINASTDTSIRFLRLVLRADVLRLHSTK